MTKKYQLLLLDANIIIELFRLNRWDQFLEKCDVYISETVCGEAEFYLNNNNEKVYIELDDTSDAITFFSIGTNEANDFLGQFDRIYAGRLDPGELESLAFMFSDKGKNHHICSADGIVFKVLGRLGAEERGISLEEIMQSIGLTVILHKKYSKEFRDRYTKMGATDRIQDL